MTDHQYPAVYANAPMGRRKAHLFRGQDVRDATIKGGVTEERVRSLCGLVNAYGAFTTDIPSNVCLTCEAIHDTDTND